MTSLLPPHSHDLQQPLVGCAANLKCTCTPASHYARCTVRSLAVGLVRRPGPSAWSVGLVRRPRPSANTAGFYRRVPSARAVGLCRRPASSASAIGLRLWLAPLASTVGLSRQRCRDLSAFSPRSTDAILSHQSNRSGLGVAKSCWPSFAPSVGSVRLLTCALRCCSVASWKRSAYRAVLDSPSASSFYESATTP